MPGQRICIFGGTFDPIHQAHLRIAAEAVKKIKLDKVLFVPAANPPHKDPEGVTPYEERFQMVQLACCGSREFVASRLEEGPERSYSVTTVERLKQKLQPDDKIFFLIGADAFDDLETWHRWPDLAKLVTFIVVTRPGHEYRVPEGVGLVRLDSVALPISSSSIRSRLAAGDPTPELSREVRKFIEDRGLYGAVRP